MKADLMRSYDYNFVDLLKVDLPELNPAFLWQKLDSFRNDPRGERLKRFLARKYKTTLSTDIVGDGFCVSGEFAMDEEKVKLFVCRSEKLASKEWDNFKFELIITLMHEYIHYMQWLYDEDEFEFVLLHKESKNESIQEDRDYYAGWSEIQAYAHCILMEMKARNANKPAHEMLRAKRVGYYSPTLKHIKSKFDGFDYPLRYLYREILRWEQRYYRLNIT
jgi:hypothetical protein